MDLRRDLGERMDVRSGVYERLPWLALRAEQQKGKQRVSQSVLVSIALCGVAEKSQLRHIYTLLGTVFST